MAFKVINMELFKREAQHTVNSGYLPILRHRFVQQADNIPPLLVADDQAKTAAEQALCIFLGEASCKNNLCLRVLLHGAANSLQALFFSHSSDYTAVDDINIGYFMEGFRLIACF